MNLFDTLPADARVWIYGADRTLDAEAQARLLARIDEFLAGWASHGRRVVGQAAVLEGRFLVIAGHMPAGDLSGCGVDASVHAIEAAGQAAGVTWLPALNVFYRDAEGNVQGVSRPEFRRLVREGLVTADTFVFDSALSTLAALRAGQLERRAADAWHGHVFRIPVDSLARG